VWVIADVPEAKLGDVQIGSPARVRAAHRGAVLEGKVSYVAPSLDPNTRSGQVRIEVANENGGLKPGMFARADIAAGGDDDTAPVLAVPEESIQRIEGKSCVFLPVEGEENTFATREVAVGRPVGGMVSIESGLREGEKVVVSGTFILKADLGKAGAAHEH
jgi:membrane fusion protein, heavy metal efflux system